MKKLRNTFCIIIFTLLFLLTAPFVFAQSEAADGYAKNIAAECEIKASTESNSLRILYDGEAVLSFSTKQSRTGNDISIQFPEGASVQGLYLKWSKCAAPWELWCKTSPDGEYELVGTRGTDGLLQEYVELPEGICGAKIVSLDEAAWYVLSMVELEVYTEGILPESVHFWEPTPTRADFLAIATHQDDEVLFFGAAIPYYANELKYDTVVLYTAFENSRRLHEACECMWYCGVRTQPVFAMFPDAYSLTIADAKKGWNEQKVTDYLTEVILSLRPNVVLTQHTNGEYGHGQHKLTVKCVKDAITAAADPALVAEKFPEYTAWDTPKLYLHGTLNDYTLRFPWKDMLFDSYGGLDGLSIAEQAYQYHISQVMGTGFRVIYDQPAAVFLDCSVFILFRSSVGEDFENNDFFENIGARAAYAAVSDSDIALLEKTGELTLADAKRNLYVKTESAAAGAPEYVRYCSYYGEKGWYLADDTGAIIEPVVPFALSVPADEPQEVSDSDAPILFGSCAGGFSLLGCFVLAAVALCVIIKKK